MQIAGERWLLLNDIYCHAFCIGNEHLAGEFLMYRFYNFGMENKVDWLVKNGKLKGKDIYVAPWNADGIRISEYLKRKWNINSVAIDDEVSEYNTNVKSWNFVKRAGKNHDRCFLLVVNPWHLHTVLAVTAINEQDIYVIKGEPLVAQDCLKKCVEDKSIHTVLDVGCGKGNHSKIFAAYGKKVTGIDLFVQIPDGGGNRIKFISGDFEKMRFLDKFDLVWCSHCLEHQINVGEYISKCFACCKDTGKVAITVPNNINGFVTEGHVSCWNAGVLMYSIIASGYSCQNAAVKTYEGNVSIVVPKEPINDGLDYRARHARAYFPIGRDWGDNGYGDVGFDGNIDSVNW